MAIPHTEDWSAGNSTFSTQDLYERTPYGPDSPDPLYPFISLAEGVTINGSGRLDWNGSHGTYLTAGVVMEGMGPDTGGDWDASTGFVECTYIPTSTALGIASTMPIMWPCSDEAFLFRLFWSWDPIDDYNIQYNTDDPFPGGNYSEYFTATQPSAGVPITYKMCWRCGTWNVSEDRHDSDGWLRLYVNGGLVWSVENIRLYINFDDYPIVDNLEGVAFGYFGLLGELDNITISDANCEDVSDLVDNLDLCCDEGDPGTVSHEGGGQSAGGFLVQTPAIGVPIGCVGGGTVPTEADIVYSETWWGS